MINFLDDINQKIVIIIIFEEEEKNIYIQCVQSLVSFLNTRIQ